MAKSDLSNADAKGSLPVVGALISNVMLPDSITLSERDQCDLEMLLSGAFHPLEGFHNFSDFESVVSRARLASGAPWPIPIVLAVRKSELKYSENPVDFREVSEKQLVYYI